MNKLNKGLRQTPKTPPANDNYRDNYERIFSKDKQTQKERNSDAN